MNCEQYPNTTSSPLGPVLVAGFAGAIAVWCVWFAAPLPWIGLPESFAIAIMAVAWLFVTAATLRLGGDTPSPIKGMGAGLVTALICLIPLSSRLQPVAASSPSMASQIPADAWQIVLLFLVSGAAIGVIAAALSRLIATQWSVSSNQPRQWLPRFAIVTAAAVGPLLFVGGLVTSNNAGMAVPDWPTTFGAQMFFYPMGHETDPDVYLEHAHRLFGTLVGLSAIVLMLWAQMSGTSSTRWAKRFCIVVFALVCLQGVLGGMRVWLETRLSGNDPQAAVRVGRLLAMVHGVSAQLVFGCIIAAAAYLTQTYQRPEPDQGVDAKSARRLKIFATALLHTLILQLVFGALTRHFRKGDHALWTHAGFSIVVVVIATIVGFSALALPKSSTSRVIVTLRRVGVALVVVTILQFLLGWVAFVVRGSDIKADTTWEALIRTAHQANGALLLAATALAFVWSRWLWRVTRPATASANPSIPTQSAAALG